MSVKEIRDFINENKYKWVGFSNRNGHYSTKHLKEKDLLLIANRLIEKIPDPRNAKQHCQSLTKKKNTKSVKWSKIITYQPESSENPNIADVKSVTTEHPKTKTIRQVEKVGFNSSLYCDTKTKKCKNNKTKTCF